MYHDRLADEVLGVLLIAPACCELERVPRGLTNLRAAVTRLRYRSPSRLLDLLERNAWLPLMMMLLATYRDLVRSCGSRPQPPAPAFGGWRAVAFVWPRHGPSAPPRPCRVISAVPPLSISSVSRSQPERATASGSAPWSKEACRNESSVPPGRSASTVPWWCRLKQTCRRLRSLTRPASPGGSKQPRQCSAI